MATERLSMRKIREILRHKWELRRSHREVKRALGVGIATVSDTITRATAAHLDWTAVDALSDEELERRLYPPAPDGIERPLPDPAALDIELRKVGVTLRLLHLEYIESNPVGAYGYTQFCEHYRAWKKTQRVTMRQVHRAGDKLFVDYSGKKPSIVDPETGERIEVELFVAVLGASNYTYAEATRTQTVADWVMSHVRSLEYFGGAPAATVPDQLKSAVTKSCRYEPGVQRTYDELGRHSRRRSQSAPLARRRRSDRAHDHREPANVSRRDGYAERSYASHGADDDDAPRCAQADVRHSRRARGSKPRWQCEDRLPSRSGNRTDL